MQPVNMDGTGLEHRQDGSTVPLKFEVFSDRELTARRW